MTAFVLGLTGPMGAGKSTVAAMLRELGAKVLDADAMAKDEQLRGTVGYSAIVQTFGTQVLGDDKEIDRAKLSTEVFAETLAGDVVSPPVFEIHLEAHVAHRQHDHP